jgi:hypothetical protein
MLVWVQLTPSPLWLEPDVVDMLAGCWVGVALSSVGCSKVSAIMGRT